MMDLFSRRWVCITQGSAFPRFSFHSDLFYCNLTRFYCILAALYHSRWASKFIIFNTEFVSIEVKLIIVNAKFIVFNAQFIIFIYKAGFLSSSFLVRFRLTFY